MLAAITIKTAGLLGIICMFLAVATIWLVMTNPVEVATVVNSGDLTSMFALVSKAFIDVFHSIARYL